MTPITTKEKAENLVNKFRECNISTVPVMTSEAVKMSIIAVDEILKTIDWAADFNDNKRNYWQEVKNHLNQM